MVRTRAVAILAALLAATVPARPGAAASCGTWEVVPSPNVGAGSNALAGVAAVSAQDVWAVGSRLLVTTYRTLVLRWDGSAWSVVPSPNAGAGSNSLAAVAAASATDVWAVGHYDDGTTFRTLTLHWDGSAWGIVRSPNTGSGENALLAVAALAPNDVWASGYATPAGSARRTLVLHWDGSSWSVVPSPSVGTDDNFLFGLAARGTDVWAVGAYSVPWLQTLTERWDGAAWTVEPSLDLGDGDNVLYAAAVLGHGSVVAVGDHLAGFGDRTLVERWDGAAWSGVRSPSPGKSLNELFGLSAAAPNDAWAVGQVQAQIGGPIGTLAMHWDGRSWRPQLTPNPGADGNSLAASSNVPGASEFWAVGRSTTGKDSTLTLHRC